MKTIGRSLTIRFLALAISTAIVGALGILGFVRLNSYATQINNIGYLMNQTTRLEGILRQQESDFLEAILSDSLAEAEEKLNAISLLDEEYLATVTQLEDTLLVERARPYLETIRNVYINESRPICVQLSEVIRGENSQLINIYLDEVIYYFEYLQATAQDLVAEVDLENQALMSRSILVSRLLGGILGTVVIVAVLASIIIGRISSKQLSRPIEKLTAAADKLAAGDIQVDVGVRANNELGTLAKAFERMVDGIRQQAGVLALVARGKYDVSIPVRTDNDVMNTAINELVRTTNHALIEMRTTSREVASASEQISLGAQSLASGSTQQASSIQEVSTTLSGLDEKTRSNAENARQADKASGEALSALDTSMRSMDELLAAMRSINESAQSITKMNKVIEDIAFQTNILALNAAVEAARAGQHGKGFSVVADEVRNLAQKSAEAASETAQLIEGSTQRVSDGNRCVELTNEQLRIAKGAAEVYAALVQEVADASESQARELGEIALQVDQIAGIVQMNSATAEQSAASSQEMSAQSTMLDEIVGRFVLQEEGQHTAPLPQEGASQNYTGLSLSRQ